MKKAFTLLELVFVIVVIGILTAIMLPRIETNPVQEAAVQLLSDIRYTQHLALVDDKFDSNDNAWYKKRWQIVFSQGAQTDNEWAYSIFADTAGASTGQVDLSEVALNPLDTGRVLSGGYAGGPIQLDITSNSFLGTKKLNLGVSYGITDVTFSNSCNGANGLSKRIVFDHFGRPMQGDISANTHSYETINLVKNDCNITITDGEQSVSIIIQPESGYANIDF